MDHMIGAVIQIIYIILQMCMYLIFASVVISWVGADPNNPLVNMINRCTEPIYRPLRKLTRNFPGPIDWAPMIAILFIIFLMKGFIPFLSDLARGGAPVIGG
jgi:YggT family protein